MRAHHHRAIEARAEIRAYTGGVATGGRYPQEPRAAGGICTVDRCQCGAIRKTNSNGRFVERGPWIGGEE